MKFSVITAVYNSAATVGDAINSVAQQTYPDLEHIIVEGKCKNGSLQAVERAGHERMSVVSEPDSGIYDALNKGIARSTGDIVGFVHSDDFLAHEDVLSRVAEAFADPGVDAAFCDLDYVSKDDPSRVVRRWKSGTFRPHQLKRGWMPPHPTLYVRREAYEQFGTFDTGFGISADYDFILRYFSKADPNAIYIPEVLYKMRLGGISNRSWRRVRQKMREDYIALKRNDVGGAATLAVKNLSKLGQFAVKSD